MLLLRRRTLLPAPCPSPPPPSSILICPACWKLARVVPRDPNGSKLLLWVDRCAASCACTSEKLAVSRLLSRWRRASYTADMSWLMVRTLPSVASLCPLQPQANSRYKTSEGAERIQVMQDRFPMHRVAHPCLVRGEPHQLFAQQNRQASL